jgi:NADH:ubiquinone oxidoreductase subunit E
MSEEIKHYLNTFDIDLLSEREQESYNLIINQGGSKRMALFSLLKNIQNKSYYLEELSELIEQYDVDINDFQ